MQVGVGCPHDGVEELFSKCGSLPAGGVRVESQESVKPDLAGAMAAVPVAGPDVHPVPSDACLLFGVAVVILGGELQGQKFRTVGPDHEDRAVLAPGRVLLVGHPGPDHFAGVGTPVATGRVAKGPIGIVRRCRGSAPGSLNGAEYGAQTGAQSGVQSGEEALRAGHRFWCLPRLGLNTWG